MVNADNQLLFLAADGQHRSSYASQLRKSNYAVSFVSNPEVVIQMIHQLKPKILIHDFDTIDHDAGIRLHQRIVKIPKLLSICRIVFAKTISANLLALSSDTLINRILSRQTVQLNLVEEVNMAVASGANLSELQQQIRSVQTKESVYNQDAIDEMVESSYKAFPHDSTVCLEFANLQYRCENYQDALQHAERLITKDPNNVRAMGLMSRILMKSGEFDQAQQVLEKANILSPLNSSRLISLGQICYEKGQKESARGYYREALKADPDDKEAIEVAANFEVLEDNPNDALAIFRNTLSEEETAGLLNNSGIKAIHEGHVEEGIKFYQLAISSLKSNRFLPQLLFNMALAQKRKNNLDEAVNYCKKALKFDPSFTKAADQLKKIEKLR